MDTYKIEITEVLQKTVEVKADNHLDAISAVEKLYKEGDIVLDAEDFIDVNIDLRDDPEIENLNKRRNNEAKIEFLRKEYPVGCKIKLISMQDPFHPIPANSIGEVTGIDDIGTIHMRWENGSSLGLIYGEDSFIKLNTLKKIKLKGNVR